MTAPALAPLPTWAARRRRAAELKDRHPFAAEVLSLYLALLEVQEQVAGETPPVDELPSWAAEQVLPRVVAATQAAGPRQLAAAAGARLDGGDRAGILLGWLAGTDLEPVDRYLARATMAPLFEARPELTAVCRGTREGGLHCPRCGAAPQLSWSAPSPEPLVAGPRRLLCSRCLWSWSYPHARCASCGESSGDRLPIFAETPPGGVLEVGGGEAAVFPHLRVEACEGCRRYVIHVDLSRDGRAVPEVDELAALPLDLDAKERGYTKATPNLLGF